MRNFFLVLLLAHALPTATSCQSNSEVNDDICPDWANVQRTILEHIKSRGYYTKYNDPSVAVSIDLFKTRGAQFIVIYSIHAPAELKTYKYIGLSLGNELVMKLFGEGGEVRKGEAIDEYLSLRSADSLWSLIAKNNFWKDNDEWELMVRVLKGKASYHNHKYDESTLFLKHNRGPSGPTRIPVEAIRLAVGTGVMYHEATKLRSQFDSPRGLSQNIDFFQENNGWVALIISVQSKQLAAYLSVVGVLKGHDFSYRRAQGLNSYDSPMQLEDYLQLLTADSLWTLIGPEGFWKTRDSMRYVFESNLVDSISVDSQTTVIDVSKLKY